jgi:hypothetical protein
LKSVRAIVSSPTLFVFTDAVCFSGPVDRRGRRQGAVSRYTRAAVPLYSAAFSLEDAPAVMRLNAFHSSV